MKLANLNIGSRLGLGFGVVLLLMAVLIGIGLQRLGKIGDLPLVALTRGQPAEKAAAQQIAALSTRGSTVTVPDAGQSILFNRPEAVIAAVMSVVDKQQP